MTNLKRRAALLILVDGQGRLLLQHRDDDAPAYPGQWGFFGGGVERGESPREGMLREALEELRYDAQGAEFAFMLHHFNERRGTTMERHYFIGRYDVRQELELNEGQAMAWYSFDGLQELNLTTQLTAAMDRIRSQVSEILPSPDVGA